MDVLHDEFCIGRNDFVGGIDNEALDFSQLEDFINNEDEGENTYFVDTLGRGSAAGAGATVVVVEGSGEDGGTSVVSTRRSLQTTTAIPPAFAHTHNLPDSPPDSGSEPPYSPQQDGGEKHVSQTKHLTAQEILLHPSHPTVYAHPHLPLKQPLVHSIQPTHLQCESMLLQHPVLTPLLSANSAILNANARNDTIILNRSDSAAILEMGPEARSPLLSLNSGIGSPVLIHSPPSGGLLSHSSQPGSPPAVSSANPVVQSIPANFDSSDGDSGISTIYSSIQVSSKKRKLSEDSAGPVLFVKQEKLEPNLDLSPESNSSQTGMADDGYDVDGNAYSDSNFQCIRFQPFQQSQWHVLCDQNLKELPIPHYRVDADKGFNFSNADDAFVCQKKNHFQITCHTQLLGDAQFIKTPEGVKKITSFYIHFYGVKVESPTQVIKVEQSQSDRSKKPFHPVHVELQGEQVTKVTVGRLHFSETTSNNMRKKGKPNPDQRYFYLVVGLQAHTCDSNYQVIAYASERIIVRASNPGQFESDVELCWQKGHTPDSIYHAGRVGINTDRPDECLVVHGNLKVTGHIVQPSDLRAKLQLEECNTKEQLKNIEQLRVVKYRYATEFAERLGIEEDTGVIAQEVQTVLPDAVRPGGDINLRSGEVIRNFLVVNKDRIFMENVGAVKELCKVTDHLGKRIEEVEKMNRRLAKLKNVDSFKSTSTSSSVSSKLPSVKVHGSKSCKSKPTTLSPTSWVCSNRAIHFAIGVLVVIMALCLTAMATLYILQSQDQLRQKQKDQQFEFFQTEHKSANRTKRPLGLAKTLSNVLSSNKTRHSYAGKDSHLGDRTNSTRLHPVHNSSLTFTKAGLDTHPTSAILPRSPRVLFRPPQCQLPTSSSQYNEGDEGGCQSFCCGDVESVLLPTAAKLPPVQDLPLDPVHNEEDPSIHTKQNEVENPPPAATNTIDVGGRPKRNRFGLHHRNRRNADDFLYPENSNFEPLPDHNGVVVTLYGFNVNQTLTAEFCASDFTSCLEKATYNYTYLIPISRYFPDDLLYVEFLFQKGRNRSEVRMCEESSPGMDCGPTRTAPEIPAPRGPNVFTVELWNAASAIIKYRVPISHVSSKNVCLASKQDLGYTYLEYNLHFYRDCEE